MKWVKNLVFISSLKFPYNFYFAIIMRKLVALGQKVKELTFPGLVWD
jgi:hypothetical protein